MRFFSKAGKYFINNLNYMSATKNISKVEWSVIALHTVKEDNVKLPKLLLKTFCTFKIVRGINTLEVVEEVRTYIHISYYTCHDYIVVPFLLFDREYNIPS